MAAEVRRRPGRELEQSVFLPLGHRLGQVLDFANGHQEKSREEEVSQVEENCHLEGEGTKKQARKKPSSKAANKKAVSIKSAKNKKAAPNKSASKSAKKTIGKKAVSGQTATRATIPGQRKGPGRAKASFSRDLRGPDAAGQSGDLQGLSNREADDSESVDELLEEGNAFEAEVLSGVEDADAR